MPKSISPPSLIVGVGASAGGLKAFESFLQGLTAPQDVGYVLVQHLDPTHDSELPGILQRVVPTPVQAVEDGMAVEAGQVYVIPSGKLLRIEDGRLRLTRPDTGPTVRTPIDTFLRSLASDQRQRAACVILSGTGTDGTLGLKAVKEHGGICLVQDPDEAEYAGMPQAAIATGLADVVAPVADLSSRLHSYLEAESRVPAPARPDPEAEPKEEASDREPKFLEQTFTLLREQTGLDFSRYKSATIWRRIRHRMQLLQVHTLDEYLQRLNADPEECQTLTREFLISVTNFFRDSEAFEALSARCIPQLFAGKRSTDTIRLWVPGCATGEEAYSLLMLLLEHRGSSDHKPSIQIFATDIDEAALDHARVGFYPTSIRADVSEARLKQFFTHEEGGYRIRPELRETILFAEHDLLTDPPFSGLDLVSCRNVLIYLKHETQSTVLTLFHYALDREKYLFLGRSETPEVRKELFTRMDSAPHLYRAQNRELEYPFPLVPGSQPTGRRASSKWRTEDSSSDRSLHRRLLIDRFVPPSVLVDNEFQIRHLMGEVGRFLQIQAGPPSNRLVDVVPKSLRTELRAALYAAFKRAQSGTVRFRATSEADGERSGPWVNVQIEPVSSGSSAASEEMDPTHALITFEKSTEHLRMAETVEAAVPDEIDAEEDQLREELRRTRHRLEVVTEEYETSNEELLASNEELQSANEELRSTMEALQTNREELQSTNEELVTVNQELKSKVEALNQRNNDIQNLLEATEIGTLYLNTDLELRRYTAQATELVHVIPSDVGRPLSHLSHEFASADLVADAREVLDTLSPITRELQSEAGGWYKVRVLPYRTVDGQVEGVLITFFDITELKEAERRVEEINADLEERVQARTRELERANERLQAEMEERERARQHFQKLFRLGPVAGLITSLDDGTILDVNERYTELTGYSREELLGSTLPELGILAPDRHDRLLSVLREEGQLRYNDVRISRPDGTTIDVMVSYEVIDQDEEPSVLSLGVDITARKEAEEALRRAKQESEEMNELKSSFIANMSHEIRTPLTGIIGFADILRDEVVGDEAREHVQYIHSNGRRLLETLDSVLDLARLDADQIHLDPTPLEVRTFAEETLALFERRAEDQGLDLTLEADEALGTVRVDESALQRILTNLVGNAIKFTEEGRVRVLLGIEAPETAPEDGRRLRLTVADTGRGMDAAFQERLFQEFTQQQSGMTRSHEGAGLGLAITQRLVALMGGEIHVDSAPGEGATFTVTVPVGPVGTNGSPSTATGEGAVDWTDGPCRVLVVDDRPEVGIIVEEFLDDCAVTAVTSAAEALAHVPDAEPFDVFLVDIQLGEQASGIDLLPDLQSRPGAAAASAPVVAITAHSLPGDRQRFLDEGFDGYLGKPFTRSDLRSTIQQALGSHSTPTR